MTDKIKPTPPEDAESIKFDDELPVLPIRNAVLFPGAVAPFDVGREKSVSLVEDIENLTQPVIAIFAQRDPSTDDPGQTDLYPVGVAARVLKALKHSSGNYSLILQGLVRVRMEHVTQQGPYLRARVSRLDEPRAEDVESEALAMSLRDIAKQVIQLMPELPREATSLIDSMQEPGALADLVAANLRIGVLQRRLGQTHAAIEVLRQCERDLADLPRAVAENPRALALSVDVPAAVGRTLGEAGRSAEAKQAYATALKRLQSARQVAASGLADADQREAGLLANLAVETGDDVAAAFRDPDLSRDEF